MLRLSVADTPLMLAVWRGHASVIKCLLAHRVDVNAAASTEQGGATALSIAAQEGREDIVKLLLQHNADPEHADRYGRTPSMVAQKAGKEKIVALLNDFQQNSAAAAAAASLLMPNGAATNTALSGSSGETKASSGYMSLSQALCSSLESPFATVSFAHPASPSNTVSAATADPTSSSAGAKAEKRNPLSSLRSAGRMTGGSSSNKSTLSSTCGSPDDDFSRRLLEHSFPKYVVGSRSRPSSVCVPTAISAASFRVGGKAAEAEQEEDGDIPTATSILEALSALLTTPSSNATSERTAGPAQTDSVKELFDRSREKSEEKNDSSIASSHNRPSETSTRDRLKQSIDDRAPSTESDSNTDSRHSRNRIITNPNYRQSSSSSGTRTVGNEARRLLQNEFDRRTSGSSDDRAYGRSTTIDDRRKESPNRGDTASRSQYGNDMIMKKETQL